MNNINTEITDDDVRCAKNKSAATIARQVLGLLETSCPYSTIFTVIPIEIRKEVEEEMKKKFELWANSWIAPAMRQIISKETRRVG
jgi:hypothetical protein